MRAVYILYILVLFFVAGCSERPKVIDEKELKEIISELVFSDVTIGSSPKTYRRDSVRFMEPILSKYGYTEADLRYTIEKLVQRKSNVLPTLITEVSDEMERQRKVYNKTSEVRAEFDKRADSMTMKELLFDSIKLMSVKYIDSVKRVFPIDESGEIEVVMNYIIDTLDKNKSHIMYLKMRDSLNKKKPEIIRTAWLSKSRDGKPNEARQTINVDAMRYNTLDIELVNLSRHSEKIEKPYVKIDSVRVVFHYKKEKARAMLMDSILVNPFKIINNKISEENGTKNSGTLPHIGR